MVFLPQRRKGTKRREGKPFASLCAFAPLWQNLIRFICKLPAGCINILPAGTPQTGIYLMLFQVSHKFIHSLFRRLFKLCKIYGVVFNNIYQVSWYLAVDFYQLISIFL